MYIKFMKENNLSPFYFFLHIPKTAGTTLRQIVDEQYGYKNVLTYYNQNSEQLLDNLESLLIVNPSYRALIGHFHFGLHQRFSFPSTYITFLRHPIARTISHYKEWVINHPERLQDRNGNIQTLLESIKTNPENYSDYQCKMLVSKTLRKKSNYPISERALENLSEKFSGIGLVEYFDKSITLLSSKFGWKPVKYDKRNVKNINVHITPELIEHIMSINKHDLIMYENIKEKLLIEFGQM
ncbi:MAG TPA: hypothetical protein EYQ26_17235 [Rhodospirillales bacterium]|nr:hypothetical protein [Rhodospirillales bacterium]